MLHLRFEHGAGGEIEETAGELVGQAERLGVMAVLTINGEAEMWALPNEKPSEVYARWKKDLESFRKARRPR